MAWFNSFLMAMAFVGLFLGAFVATTYIDRFGRKNAILVWTAISTTCSVIQAFIPDKYSFLVFKLLVAGANVRIQKKLCHKTAHIQLLNNVSILIQGINELLFSTLYGLHILHMRRKCWVPQNAALPEAWHMYIILLGTWLAQVWLTFFPIGVLLQLDVL